MKNQSHKQRKREKTQFVVFQCIWNTESFLFLPRSALFLLNRDCAASGWDASPSQVKLSPVFLSGCPLLGVKCLAHEHNTMTHAKRFNSNRSIRTVTVKWFTCFDYISHLQVFLVYSTLVFLLTSFTPDVCISLKPAIVAIIWKPGLSTRSTE